MFARRCLCLILSLAAAMACAEQPEDESSAWMLGSVVSQIRNWAAVPGQVLTLTLRGVSRSVMFRHQDGGLEAKPVVHYRDRDNSDFYLCTVRFMEIA